MDDRRLSNERVTVVTAVAHIIQFSADLSVPLLYHTQESFVKVGWIKCAKYGYSSLFELQQKTSSLQKSNEDAYIRFMKAAFSILESFPKHFADSQ